MLPGALPWMTGASGSGTPARLPPRTSLSHRVPELIRPHVRKPPSPSGRTPISVRCGSAATESRLSSLGSKGSRRGNASRCRASGGLPSGAKRSGSARMARKTTCRSSSRSMLAWKQAAKKPSSAAASGNGSTPSGGSGTSLHRSRTNRARSPGYSYPGAACPDPAGVGFPSSIFAPLGRWGGASSAVDGWRGAVLLVADGLAPGRGVAFVVDLHHRYVGHEALRGGTVPVVLAGLEEHTVARADHLDRYAAALREAGALGDVDGLAVRVGVPSGPSAGREVYAARLQARGTRRRRDRVD